MSTGNKKQDLPKEVESLHISHCRLAISHTNQWYMCMFWGMLKEITMTNEYMSLKQNYMSRFSAFSASFETKWKEINCNWDFSLPSSSPSINLLQLLSHVFKFQCSSWSLIIIICFLFLILATSTPSSSYQILHTIREGRVFCWVFLCPTFAAGTSSPAVLNRHFWK